MGNQSSSTESSAVSTSDILGRPIDSAKDALKPLKFNWPLATGFSTVGGGGADQKDLDLPSEIVVVNQAAKTTTADRLNQIRSHEELMQLASIPVFMPVLKSSVGPAAQKKANFKLPPNELLRRFDPQNIGQLLRIYQIYLTGCAESVSAEQLAISVRIKEVNAVVQKLDDMVWERSKSIGKSELQLQKFQDLSNVIERIETNLRNVRQLCNSLNRLLPDELRLDELT